MDWIRHNVMAFIVLAAVVVSFVVGYIDAEAQRDQERVEALTACTLSSERGALVAAYQRETADSRRSTGDVAIARRYEAYARGTIDALQVTPFVHPISALYDVRTVEGPDGDTQRLAESSKAAIAAACEQVYSD